MTIAAVDDDLHSADTRTFWADDMSLMPDQKSDFYRIKLTRVDRDGLIFLTCADLPDFFVSLLSEEDIRQSLDETLKTAFSSFGVPEAQVYTNGRIDGPSIDTVVCVK